MKYNKELSDEERTLLSEAVMRGEVIEHPITGEWFNPRGYYGDFAYENDISYANFCDVLHDMQIGGLLGNMFITYLEHKLDDFL